jgi:lipocalin
MSLYKFLIGLYLGTLVSIVLAQTCPIAGFDAKNPFDLAKYLGRWYSIEQIPLSFQPLSQFYCVYVDYTEQKKSKGFFCSILGGCDQPAFDVFNSGDIGQVNSKVPNTINFVATIPKPGTDPAKAYVGPGFLPPKARKGTNYWVLDAGIYDDLVSGTTSGSNYDWAIITAGEPNLNGGKCYPDTGFWLFTRDPVPPAGIITAMKTKASTTFGLDISVLQPVTHTGCNYERPNFIAQKVGQVVGVLDYARSAIGNLFGGKL